RRSTGGPAVRQHRVGDFLARDFLNSDLHIAESDALRAPFVCQRLRECGFDQIVRAVLAVGEGEGLAVGAAVEQFEVSKPGSPIDRDFLGSGQERDGRGVERRRTENDGFLRDNGEQLVIGLAVRADKNSDLRRLPYVGKGHYGVFDAVKGNGTNYPIVLIRRPRVPPGYLFGSESP